MKPERVNTLRAAIEQVGQRHWAYREGVHASGTAESLGELAEELLAAHDFWRSVARRGPITVSTVIAFEITPAKLDAWLRAQPEMTAEREDGSDEIDWHMRDLYVCTTGHGDRREAVRAINTMASELNRDRWDIIAEIAAMEVSDA